MGVNMKIRAFLNHIDIDKISYETVIYIDEKRIVFENKDFYEAQDKLKKMAKFFKLKRTENKYAFEFMGEI